MIIYFLDKYVVVGGRCHVVQPVHCIERVCESERERDRVRVSECVCERERE